MTKPTRPLALILGSLSLLAACVADSEATPSGELLFELGDEEVQLIHANYLADEDIEQVRAKLTAPFDCELYGDLCGYVGRDAAIELTERQVEMALAGASRDEISAYLDVALAEASEARRELEAELVTRANATTRDWGVEVLSVQVQEIDARIVAPPGFDPR